MAIGYACGRAPDTPRDNCASYFFAAGFFGGAGFLATGAAAFFAGAAATLGFGGAFALASFAT